MRSPSSRILCVAATLVCLTINGLGILDRLRPGNQDDKTLHYATSALGPRSIAAVLELEAALPTIVASCHGPREERCRERATTRISSLMNYMATAATIRLARFVVDRSQAPFCERVSLAYYAGILLLHGLVAVLFLLLVFTDRTPEWIFSILALHMILAAVLALPSLGLAEVEGSELIPLPHPAHATGSYAPRGALALVFLLQAAAFAGERHRAWIGLTFLAVSIHLAQAMLLGTVFVAALALRVALVADQRRTYVELLCLSVVVTLACWLVARATEMAEMPTLSVGAALGALRLRDLVWLLAAGASLTTVVTGRSGPALTQPLLLFAAFLVVLTAIDALTAALAVDPQSAPGQLFVRFYSGSSFVLGMVPWLGVTFVARRALQLALPRLQARLVRVSAVVVLAVSASVLLAERTAVVAAWERAQGNLAAARDDLCLLTRCENGCTFRGFGAMNPSNEAVFHLQIFDYLNHRSAF